MADKLEVYTKDTKAWFKDTEEGYIVATLESKAVDSKNVQLRFTLDSNGQKLEYSQTVAKLEASNYDDLPFLKNPPRLEGADDLTHLSYLHEAAVLHSVKLRYQQEMIYTYSGLVLIAMNPFRKMNIYTLDIMRQYVGRPRQEMEPHLFAVAEEAYRKMLNQKENQSIIVSGESGAGKTQSAKFVMRYFAIVDDLESNIGSIANDTSNSSITNGSTSIEDAVLSTNPIMEAFGNAKTTRNDNSSRFGKYIEILFNRKPNNPLAVTIIGARMRTYLLERSRLTFQPDSERNYHIFYQLCAAVPAAEKKELGLDTWDKFFYLRQGKTGTVNGMNDVEEFAITQKGMSSVGIGISTQWDIFKICAALLHIGNIKITEKNGNADIAHDNSALLFASKLIGVDVAIFKKWLIKKQITLRSEKIEKDANVSQAINSRDSIAKFIYSMLFDWIVKIVNLKLDTSTSLPASEKANLRFIGVLDIYGFEHFTKNSFEQFCINFANEKLQQEFTRHVFKLEQEEYVREKISWSFIDFSDNQPCINLIEGKLGIMDLLDEESRLPSGSDSSLVVKLYNRFAVPEQKFFGKPRFGEVEFVIKHYALDVTYQIEGFIEKNKDTVSEEQLLMLNDSSFEFFKQVIMIEEVVEESAVSKAPKRGGIKKPTLGSIFKGSLIKLMDTLRETNPHFIRCIKPNQSKMAFEFEPQNVLGQLIACGVLETIKISRAGYPSKQTFSEFNDRYYLLAHSSEWKQDAKKLAEKIVKMVIKGENKYEFGTTKIFFRAGQLALFEKVRSEKFTAIVKLLQKNALRYYHVRRYKKIKVSTLKIQAVWRGHVTRKAFAAKREEHAAIKIQRELKMSVARKKYQKTLNAALVIQRAWRRHMYQKDHADIEKERAAKKIQAVFRMHREKKIYKQTVKNITIVQSLSKRRKARSEFKQLKEEALAVGQLKETNYALESKLFEISYGLDDKKKEVAELTKQVTSLEESLSTWKDKARRLEIELKAKGQGIAKEYHDLKKQIVAAHEYKEVLSKETDKLNGMIRKRDDNVAFLKQELDKIKAENKSLKSQIAKAPKKDDYETNRLKKENANLKEQLGRLVAGKYRTERNTERFLNNDSAPKKESSAASSQAVSAAMSFLESAAQVTARVVGTATNRSVTAKPYSRRQVEIEEDVPKDRGIRMLEARDLEDEVIDSLIINLRIPLPSSQNVASKREIFFPAHLIGFLISQFVEYKLVVRMHELLSNVMRAIQQLTMKFEDDYVSAFWLSNCCELISVIRTARMHLPRPAAASQDDEISASAVLATVNKELEILMIDIYVGWINEFKKRLTNMIVPAVIEHQGLPGYVCKDGGYGLWSNWSSRSSTVSQFTIDQLLNFLSKLSKTMRCYYMEDSMNRQILTELFRVIGVSAFNHLLVRKNFWIQIQYNVSRLEEWCTGNGIPEATIHLQQLLQAAKLLCIEKSPSKIEEIFETCFLLNETQIKKLLTLYRAADYDSPLSPELLEIITDRHSDKEEPLLLEIDTTPELFRADPKNITQIERFIPEWINLPVIQAILSSKEGPSELYRIEE